LDGLAKEIMEIRNMIVKAIRLKEKKKSNETKWGVCSVKNSAQGTKIPRITVGVCSERW